MSDQDQRYFLISEDTLKSISSLSLADKFKNLVWTTDINTELPTKIHVQSGPGSEPPKTLPYFFLQKYAAHKDEVCMQAIKEDFG